MNPFGGIVQKAFYLGLGLATVAGEKAGETLGELRTQASLKSRLGRVLQILAAKMPHGQSQLMMRKIVILIKL